MNEIMDIEYYDPEDFNIGTIKFKLKLFDDFYDFVIDWSQENEGYEKSQIFDQFAAITGIPSKYTTDVKLGGEESEYDRELTINNPEANVALYTRPDYFIDPLCNEFVAELAESIARVDNDYFVLVFRMWLEEDKHFYIYYELLPRLIFPETQCSRSVCLYQQNPVILGKFRALITDDKLYAKMVEMLPDDMDDEPEIRDDALIDLNVFQYYCMPCATVSDPLGHFYTRERG